MGGEGWRRGEEERRGEKVEERRGEEVEERRGSDLTVLVPLPNRVRSLKRVCSFIAVCVLTA